MRPPVRHPRIAAIACKAYGLLMIRMYPAEFRRSFGDELAITFRNCIEDVLNEGGPAEWASFALRIALDGINTSIALTAEPPAECLFSILGLRDGYIAHGYIDPTRLESMIAAMGFAFACSGYLFFALLPTYVSR
ncbi:MAG TPA: hypothetical protein VJP86_01720 [Vicinamibacterales bacterium]|jgi:hypothetical protein|nr:hypothetical protein [Vicinamibacterales bacterium]